MEKIKVTISRYWNNPLIKTTMTDESISLSVSMDDFLSAVKNEIGSVSTTFTQKAFELKFDDAVKTVLGKIKEESIKAI